MKNKNPLLVDKNTFIVHMTKGTAHLYMQMIEYHHWIYSCTILVNISFPLNTKLYYCHKTPPIL